MFTQKGTFVFEISRMCLEYILLYVYGVRANVLFTIDLFTI